MSKGNEWRTLRCVVEVKVPPNNPTTERELRHQVQMALGKSIALPRALYPNAYQAKVTAKGFSRVLQHVTNRPPKQTIFEQLVIRGIYAILSLVMRGSAASRATAMLRQDLHGFLTGDQG